MTSREGWAAHPDAVGPPRLPGDGDPDAPVLSPVVGVGALCQLAPRRAGADESAQGFTVGEFVVLEDGRRVVLHQDRGFTLGAAPGSDVREGLTTEILTSTVLAVVLPDDEDAQEDHPWAWLAELARAKGVSVSDDGLRSLGYDVVLADDVRRWLGQR